MGNSPRIDSKVHVTSRSCQNPMLSLLGSWFPHRLEFEDHARPWFCPKLVYFLLSSWFPHRLESEDHARPWFCPKHVVFSKVSPSIKVGRVSLRLEAPRAAHAIGTARRSP